MSTQFLPAAPLTRSLFRSQAFPGDTSTPHSGNSLSLSLSHSRGLEVLGWELAEKADPSPTTEQPLSELRPFPPSQLQLAQVCLPLSRIGLLSTN